MGPINGPGREVNSGHPGPPGAILPGRIAHSLKFAYTELASGLDTSRAVELKPDRLPEYRRFFETVHPVASVEGLKEYFLSVTRRR